jgi:hypothetical protein
LEAAVECVVVRVGLAAGLRGDARELGLVGLAQLGVRAALGEVGVHAHVGAVGDRDRLVRRLDVVLVKRVAALEGLVAEQEDRLLGARAPVVVLDDVLDRAPAVLLRAAGGDRAALAPAHVGVGDAELGEVLADRRAKQRV